MLIDISKSHKIMPLIKHDLMCIESFSTCGEKPDFEDLCLAISYLRKVLSTIETFLMEKNNE